MKAAVLIVWLALLVPLAQAQTLAAGEELTLDPPWVQPLALDVGAGGTYRLKAVTLDGQPVEALVEARSGNGPWTRLAGSRTLLGSLEAETEFTATGAQKWRVRPAEPVRQTVVLGLRRSQFSALRDTLKERLTAPPAQTLPLQPHLPPPPEAPARGPGWVTPWGEVRLTEGPVLGLERHDGAFWTNLELPRDRSRDRLLAAVTADGLYVVTGSTADPGKALYRWSPGEGWTALPPPASDLPAADRLWDLGIGAGGLVYVEGRGSVLGLQVYDGFSWRPRLDLAPLSRGPVEGLTLAAPGPASRSGLLLLRSGGTLQAFDLP